MTPARRAAVLAAGLCLRCGRPGAGGWACPGCRAWWRDRQRRRRAGKAAAGLCIDGDCRNEAAPLRARCVGCLRKQADRKRKDGQHP